MKKWTKKDVLKWFKVHAEKIVVVKLQGTTLRIEGRAAGVDEIDACSADIFATGLGMVSPGLDTSISFHENSLSVHLLVRESGSKRSILSMPVSIPYGLLQLSTPAEEKRVGKARAPKREEPEFSPYELLR